MIVHLGPRVIRQSVRYPLLTTLALFLGWASSTVAAEVPAGCDVTGTPPVLDFSHPLNLTLIKRQLLLYRCTRYDKDIELVLREAQDWVKQRASQVANAAIVLDIDETSL